MVIRAIFMVVLPLKTPIAATIDRPAAAVNLAVQVALGNRAYSA
jgi:hypothetical protein